MIEWLDSAWPPNTDQISAARAAGYSGWAGYFAGPNILNGWAKSDFDRVKAGGLRTMAYCSGWSTPASMRAQGAAWAVTICLDDESAIRPTGGWEQAWLDVSGAGQYGNYWLHPGIRAAFHILAAYPTSGDPTGADWWAQTPRPGGLTGWQFAGSHDFASITVDSSWFDDGIAVLGFGPGGGTIGGEQLTPGMKIGLANIAFNAVYRRPPTQKEEFDFANTLADDGSNFNTLVDGLNANSHNADTAPLQPDVLRADVNKALAIGSGPDDDSAFVTKAGLKTAIGGL